MFKWIIAIFIILGIVYCIIPLPDHSKECKDYVKQTYTKWKNCNINSIQDQECMLINTNNKYEEYSYKFKHGIISNTVYVLYSKTDKKPIKFHLSSEGKFLKE